MKQNLKKIFAFATQGTGGLDELRLKILLEDIPIQFIPIEKNNILQKIKSASHILKTCGKHRPDLIIMEGTGLLGGIPLILAKIFFGTKYIVSSGDAIGPFYGLKSPFLKPIGTLYEKILYRFSRGFIGWTPYLVGRALTYGSPQGITIAGFQKFKKTKEEHLKARIRIREKLGIAPDTIVIGIVGSLTWNSNVEYCYGLEIVKAFDSLQRKNIIGLIVGDGDGKIQLERLASTSNQQNLILTGNVDPKLVQDYLSAMDIASLPQSVDGVGNFRYTTKMSEYISAGLPMIVAQNPFAYDLDQNFFWRLPGKTPWSQEYINSIRNLLETISHEDIKKKAVFDLPEFDLNLQKNRIQSFIQDLS